MCHDIPTVWTTIEQFARTIDAIAIIGDEVVTSPNFGRWRDGHIALQVARASGASHVRLLAEPKPDFAIRVEADEFLYEATELLKPGRRRHDEYRAAATSGKTTQSDPEHNWINQDQFLATLRDRATSKSRKQYPLGCHLVIYINVGFIRSSKSVATSLVEMFGLEALLDAAQLALIKFEQVHLLHNRALITLKATPV